MNEYLGPAGRLKDSGTSKRRMISATPRLEFLDSSQTEAYTGIRIMRGELSIEIA
jgi:hypothetical protein